MSKSQNFNVVLVHGGFVDGAGWEDVYKALRRDGYKVSIVQNPTTSLADDVAATRLVLDSQDKPTILVGHSYGGVVITVPGAPVPPILPPQNGFLFLEKAKFQASFAADVDDDEAEFMADSQVPWGVDALGGEVTQPAWAKKPSWYLVAGEDKMIPPEAQRFMSKRIGATTVEERGSHAIYVSKPQVVAALIKKAAQPAE